MDYRYKIKMLAELLADYTQGHPANDAEQVFLRAVTAELRRNIALWVGDIKE